jgi:probable phosphoglycerate mutase
MTRILLVRHATNDLSEAGVLAGWTPDVHLNTQGRAEAAALARRLSAATIDTVCSSPLERTVETAEILAGPHALPVQVREQLGEVRYGRWTGVALEKLRRRRLWRHVQFTPSTMRFPGGESVREAQARVVAELEELRAAHPDQTVVVVSHADIIKSAVAYYIGLHLDLFQRLVVQPASLSVLHLNGLSNHLECLNDTAHLPPDLGQASSATEEL